MTVCNMSIEAGARAGMIAPDDTTFAYLEGRPAAPTRRRVGAGARRVARAAHRRRRARSTTSSRSTSSTLDAAGHVGHEPGHGRAGRRRRARPGRVRRPGRARGGRAGAALHGARAGHADPRDRRSTASSSARARTRGSRTCARRPRSSTGRHVAPTVRAMVVPGSAKVKRQAEEEGLDRVFTSAGFEWRQAGCSMCLGMNPDILAPGERCASTSNRNFEGRQGAGGRTHLVSPAMAAAAAITGRFADVRELRMRELRQVTGRAAVLDRADVDTDQIIPKQFLKRIERSGYGEFLFFDWMKDPDFELHRPEYEGAQILVAGPQLRLRLVARARRLGARGLRLPRRRSRRASATSSARTRSRPGSRRSSCPRRSSAQIKAALAHAQRADRRPRDARDHAPGRPADPVRARRVRPRDAAPRPRRHRAHAAPRGADRRLRGVARPRGSTRARSRRRAASGERARS